MGPLEKAGSPFVLEGHSHWAPSSVWRKELPSCLLWQNLPEDSDTIAHLAPCFLSFFFSILLKFPTLTAWPQYSQPFDMCQMRLNWPRPLSAQLTFWRALDYVRTQTQIPSHTYWCTWGSGTHLYELHPQWQLLEGRWTGGREGTVPLRHAPWMQRSGWWTRVTERVADPGDCEVPSWPPLGPTSRSPASLSAQEPWEDQGSTKRTMGSSLQGLAGRSRMSAVQWGGGDLEGVPIAHSRAPRSRHSSDDICEPSFSASPSCLPFLPHPGALEGMAREKEPLKSLDS